MISMRQYSAALRRNFTLYAIGVTAFVLLMAVLDAMGVFRATLGYIFAGASILVYALIGWFSRTDDPDEFFVAGRHVPAIYNGMATAADWMSAASFIGMAGSLYSLGYNGLAFVMGWTGGYVLIALLLAPYLRQLRIYTVPDFFGARYGGHSARMIAVMATIICSFVYVVAQIYGVGLIAQRLTGADFAVGVFVGLAGIIVCSFMGGMKAVTWTQVAQYIVLIGAYLVPTSMLALNQTGVPIPQIMYGTVLEKLTVKEKELVQDQREVSARNAMKGIASQAKETLNEMAKGPVEADAVYAKAKKVFEDELAAAESRENFEEIAAAKASLATFPKDVEAFKKKKTGEMGLAARAVPPAPHAKAYQGATEEARLTSKLNFMALMFSLMVGTAALPHVLVRYMTTPSVKEARDSVFWSLLFILALYITAPALAVMVKFDIYTNLVGTKFEDLPFWAIAWAKVDASLLSIADYNKDGIVQLAEVFIGPDLIVLATPEIAGLPFVISALIAVGGFAAALSTADGLLMAMSSSLSHDTYYKVIDPKASGSRRATVAKITLLVMAGLAAVVTMSKPGSILFLVAAAFSLAAAGIFPGLVLGIFWRRANRIGVVLGMLAGLGVTMYYMARTYQFFLDMGVPKMGLWFGIQPVGSGVFGVAVGFLTIIVVSLLTPRPSKSELAVLTGCRYPHRVDD